ncbi:helix-turn-helix domain-containing protein [Alteromonas sp. ALT199]|uniref:IclR family transcriptional regulator n=1 Tax=unclassified Alteromonas TaxID=2614992 RepID=UPI00044D2E1F|nr:helix-turn-helix domain-containing protein [Alteromonas sp. ALT199]MBT3136410.1 helix-turn-helix domain-containing protein [Alteromonas sp. ALT199]
MEKEKYAVPAVDKCFEIMDFLAQSGKACSQSEIAKGINKGTNQIYRILVNLTASGYLNRNESNGKYGLSFKLYNLSRSISPLDEIRKHALPLMEELAAYGKLSCQLFVLYQSQAMVLVQARNPYSVSLNYAEGSLFSCYASNPGNLLLAHSSKYVQQVILDEVPDWHELSCEDRNAFEDKLAYIAKTEQWEAPSQHLLGIRESVCLVGQPEGKQIAALMVSHLTKINNSGDEAGSLELMKQTAHLLTKKLNL